jgi:pyrroline-5-carboxylate reductase
VKSEIFILGGGNMGLAYASCLLKTKVSSPQKVIIIEARAPRRRELHRILTCKIVASIPKEIPTRAAVILAVKPQDMREACTLLQGKIKNSNLVISVMAGIEVRAIKKLLGNQISVVRCMPNLPAKIGIGVTVAHIPLKLPRNMATSAREILRSTGSLIEVKSETLLNQATAVSGSGPAYLFYIAEHFIRVAVALGFSHMQAKQMVADTIIGAAHLWRESGEDPQTLRERVTSKKGATNAAVLVFEEGRMGETLRNGVRAAYRRARELARFARK